MWFHFVKGFGRYKRWEAERVVSFVPPEGIFQLMTYRVREGVVLPLYEDLSCFACAHGCCLKVHSTADTLQQRRRFGGCYVRAEAWSHRQARGGEKLEKVVQNVLRI